MDYHYIKKLILNKLCIKDVVDHYLGSGKKVGKQFFYRSPFKDFDRTPSLSVEPSMQIFKCFATGKGGNLIKFVAEIEKVSYEQAIEIIIKKFLPEYSYLLGSITKNEYYKYTAFMRLVAAEMHRNILKNKEALEYLKKRGIKQHIIEKMMIGFVKNIYDLNNILEQTKNEFDEDFSNFITIKKSKYLHNISFISFPIINKNNEVVGIDFRAVHSNRNNIRYIAQVNNKYYDSKEILYGENLIDPNNKEIFVVEGHMDLLSLAQEGANVIALRGSSYKEKIKHICQDKIVYLFLDNDETGIKSAVEIGLNIIKDSMVFVVNSNPFKDASEMCEKIGINLESTKRKLSVFFIDFFINLHKKGNLDNAFLLLKSNIKPENSADKNKYIMLLNRYADNAYKANTNIEEVLEIKNAFLENYDKNKASDFEEQDRFIIDFLINNYSEEDETKNKEIVKALSLYKPTNKNLFSDLFFCVYNNCAKKEIINILNQHGIQIELEANTNNENNFERELAKIKDIVLESRNRSVTRVFKNYS